MGASKNHDKWGVSYTDPWILVESSGLHKDWARTGQGLGKDWARTASVLNVESPAKFTIFSPPLVHL